MLFKATASRLVHPSRIFQGRDVSAERDSIRQLGRVAELVRPAPLEEFEGYDGYWAKRGRTRIVYRRWTIALEEIADGESVLDIGCGPGEFLRLVTRERPSCRVAGMDVSRVAVDLAREQGLEAHRADIELESIAGEFDRVTCFEVLEHLPHAENALRQIMLASRRSAIVSIPNVGFIGCRLRLGLFGRFPTTCCVFHIREHLRFWTVRDFHEWIEASGFRIVRQRPQSGVPVLRRLMPSVFASGMVYVIDRPSP